MVDRDYVGMKEYGFVIDPRFGLVPSERDLGQMAGSSRGRIGRYGICSDVRGGGELLVDALIARGPFPEPVKGKKVVAEFGSRGDKKSFLRVVRENGVGIYPARGVA